MPRIELGMIFRGATPIEGMLGLVFDRVSAQQRREVFKSTMRYKPNDMLVSWIGKRVVTIEHTTNRDAKIVLEGGDWIRINDYDESYWL